MVVGGVVRFLDWVVTRHCQGTIITPSPRPPLTPQTITCCKTHVHSMRNTRTYHVKHTFIACGTHVHSICETHVLGLSRSSDLAREVLVYLFHGKCPVRETQRGQKRSSIIFELRRQYMHGLNVFSKATLSFQKFVNYLALVPQQKMGLTDPKFETTSEFVVYAELGLRTFAMTSNRPLGKHAMRSAKDWGQVHLWKKRETWVHVGLDILRTGSLSRWTSFKWSDHQLLRGLGRVFKKKILPISDGCASELMSEIEDPPSWKLKNSKKSTKSPRTPSSVRDREHTQPSQSLFVDLVSSDDDEVCYELFSCDSHFLDI